VQIRPSIAARFSDGNKQVFVLKKQEKNKKTCQSTPMNSTGQGFGWVQWGPIRSVVLYLLLLLILSLILSLLF
jgi:hypothetical protein